jgi:hypothetical protein
VIIWHRDFVCGILAIILPLMFSFGIALIIGCLSWSRESRTLFLRFRHASLCDPLRGDPRFEQIVTSFAPRE